jgi:hypothetical protein
MYNYYWAKDKVSGIRIIVRELMYKEIINE